MNKNCLVIFQSPNNGGTRTYFFYLMEYLLEKNIQINLLVQRNEFSGVIPAFCYENNIQVTLFDEQIKDVKLYHFKSFKWTLLFCYNYLKQVAFLWRLWFEVRPQFTIISQGWPFMWFRALYLPGKKIFVQHVMPLHDMDKGNRFFLKLAMLLRQGTFISVSDFAQDKMRIHWLGTYKKVKTIYNFVTIKDRTQVKKEGDYIHVLCLARVEEGKNPMRWIEVAKEITAKHSNVSFTWAGKGSLLDDAIAETTKDNQINFIGFVNNVDALYAKTDIYFEPSKREAHGISVVGAMAWGIPAIATKNGGTTESVKDGETGFIVDVTYKEEMIEKLEILINDSKLRKIMGDKGQKRHEALFTREIWEEEMNELIIL